MRTKRILLPGVSLLAMAMGVAWGLSGRLDGPWGMLPGGPFRGAGRACPTSGWERFADVREIEIEVRPDRPRSVTTWSVVHDGALYVPADFLTPWKRWPHQVLSDDRIRIRIAGQVFACRAERIEEPALVEALRRATLEKYDLAPDGRAARVEVWWFRIR